MFSSRPNSAVALKAPAPEPEPQAPPEPQPQTEPQEFQVKWTIEEIVPMVATVIIVAVLVALLVLYISEYARISKQGYAQQSLRGKIQQEYRSIATLRAEVTKLKQQERIVTGAQSQGMVRLTQVQKMPVPSSLLPSRAHPAPQVGSEVEPGAGLSSPAAARLSSPPLALALAAEGQGR